MKQQLLTLLILAATTLTIKADYLSDVDAWVGEGSNYSILIIDFADTQNPSSSIMWGVRYDSDSISAQMMLDTIAQSDPKLSGNFQSFITDLYYKNLKGESTSDFSWYWLTHTLKQEGGEWEINEGNPTKLGNGQAFGTVYTDTYPGNNPRLAISADLLPKERPLLSNSDISQWIGKGPNEAALIVDFGSGNGDDVFSWGIRFDTDSISGQDILNAVSAADSNFKGDFETYVTDIIYKNNEGISPVDFSKYWLSYTSNSDYNNWSDNNGNATQIGDEQWFGVRFSDSWPAPHPDTAITAIISSEGIEDVIIGSPEVTPTVEGIEMTDSKIELWASQIIVNRGFLNIEDTLFTENGSNKASFGLPENAEGAATGESGNVVSLGDAGVATASFNSDKRIINGEGPDFVVFENGFGPTVLELAFVEVSSNGIDFVRFPSKSETKTTSQIETYGSLDPSLIYGLAGIHPAGVGTPFDLEELKDSNNININDIIAIRIIDVVGSIGPGNSVDAEGTIVNDPFPTAFSSGGFDLEAIGVINHKTVVGLESSKAISISTYPNPCNTIMKIDIIENIDHIIASDLMGKSTSLTLLDNNQVDVSGLQNGQYNLLIITEKNNYTSRIQVMK